MQPNKIIYSLIVSSVVMSTSGTARAADEQLCAIENSALICGASLKDGGEILEAMSNPATMEMLIKTKASGLVYNNSDQREVFRKSLEANRGSMKKYADRAWKQYRQKRLKADAYEVVRTKYKAGMKAYRAAMQLYRAGTWGSKTKGKQAD
ncbi:MAG: hypothetical protein V3V02_07020 [Rhizobiaceae bacterium]